MDSFSSSYKKTIVYVDHTACLGGGEIALLNLISAIDKSRFSPIVILGEDGPFAESIRAEGIRVFIEPLDGSVLDTRKDSLKLRSLLSVGRFMSSLRYIARISALAKTLGADVIHTNSLKADVLGGIAGRLAGIPVIWHIRDNISAPYLPSHIASLFRFLTRWLPTRVITNSKSTLRTLHLGSAAVRTTSTPATEFEINENLNSASEKRAYVVYCGCVTDNFKNIPEEHPNNQTVTIVGRITEWKGQDVFINAAAQVLTKFPGAKFQIVGSPMFGEHDFERRLHEMVKDLNVESSIKFLGFRKDIPEIMRSSAIVVHASTIGEPFGQVVVEAMASGRPVIATAGGALPEIVADGETGLLVPMKDSSAMGDAISRLLADRPWAEKLGAAARSRVQNLFTIERTARGTEAIYESVFSRENPILKKLRSVA